MNDRGAASDWVVIPRRDPRARLRLFCLPHAGGGASLYRSWPDDLPPQIEVCAIQLPGRETRWKDSPFSRVEPLVASLCEILGPYLELPYALFGHSMGALIAFELARQARRQYGTEPAHLFVAARRAPQMPEVDPPTYCLPDEAFLAELHRLNGTPRPLLDDPELIALMLPTLRADLEICQTYEYIPDLPLRCPLTVYGGLQDPEVPRDRLGGWRELTEGPFVLRMAPGGHFFVETSRALILDSLARELYQIASS